VRYEYSLGSQSIEMEYETGASGMDGREPSEGGSVPVPHWRSLSRQSPLTALLIAVSSPCLGPLSRHELLSLASGVEWEAFDALARKHKLVFLAESRLRRLSSLPEVKQILMQSRKSYFATLRRNLELDNLTVQLAILLSSADLPVLLFTGTPFLRQSYGDVGIQEVDNVELMIRPEHLTRACNILRSIGFRENSSRPCSLLETPLALSRLIRGSEFRVLLHSALATSVNSTLLVEEMWQTAVPYSESAACDFNWCEYDQRLLRPNIFALSTEFQWLQAALRGFETHFEPWARLADLCQTSMVTQRFLHWEHLSAWMEKFGLRSAVRGALEAAQSWGLQVPDGFVQRVHPRLARSLSALAEKPRQLANPLDFPWKEAVGTAKSFFQREPAERPGLRIHPGRLGPARA
jgi:hypothetical protein